jgi:hypothetical protein
VDAIKRHIENGELVVAPSFEVLDELLRSPDISQEGRIRNAQFYDRIVNWNQTVKPSNNMIADDIRNLAVCGAPSTPYRAVDAENSGFIQSIRRGENIFPEDDWNNVIKKTDCQNKKFVEDLFEQFFGKLPKESKQKFRAKTEEIWRQWWSKDGLASKIGSSLATKLGLSPNLPVLSLPSVRAGVGYILDTWKIQILNGLERVRPTVHVDFRNTVIAGGVGRIATNDKKFRNTMNRIPGLEVEVLALEELIAFFC